MPLFKAIQLKLDWLFLIAFIFIPRPFTLDRFLTADETLFLEHARDFATGVSSGNLGQTLGIGYPGVTVAGWAAPVVNLPQTELGAYAAGRLVTAIFTGLLLLALYGLAKLLLGQWPAFIGVALLALDPYTLGYSRLLHIAAPLALFMTLTGISTLLWFRTTRRRWLLLTGCFTGLALLTKSTALLLAPMVGTLIIGWGLTTQQGYNFSWWLRIFKGALAIVAVAAITFFALWPAMWVDLPAALNLTFGKLFVDQEAGTGNLGLYWLGQFVEDPGPMFYPVAFLLKSTPWLLIGLLLSLIQLFRNNESAETVTQNSVRSLPVGKLKIQNSEPETRNLKPETLTLWLFALTYLILMTIASKKSIRYLLPAFPVFYLLAGIAFYQITQSIKRWENLPLLPRFPAPLLAVTIGLLFFTLFYHPYYLTYYNPLLLGWRWAPQAVLVGWGEGLDGAARYLENQPNYQEMEVSAWYEWLFPLLYSGPVQSVVPQENLITADRTVLYINQVQRDIPGPNIIHYFQTRRQPEHVVRLAGINYAWVYPGPIAGFGPDPAPQVPLTGNFGDEIRLLGYNLDPQPASGGDSLIVTLFWRALTQPADNRFVYLRLVDDQGHIWVSADSPPVMGLWPTTKWQPNMLIEDAHELPVPPGTPPGDYRLEVGMYSADTETLLPAAGQPIGQGGGLLLGEVNVQWKPLTAESDLPQQMDFRLAPNARLVGYRPPATTATTGDLLSIELAWRQSATLSSFLFDPLNDYVMFEWRQQDRPIAEHLAPLPLPINQWGRGALMRSQHNLIVPPTLNSGQYDLVVMLHNGSDPAGAAFKLEAIDVTAPLHQFELPADVQQPVGQADLTAEAGQSIQLAGYSYQIEADGMGLTLYWQTDAPLTTGYKIFAQLLAPDNSLVVQSDSFPAEGQRPTTGWLPGEIIADAHQLHFDGDPPSGSFTLITGMYNPATGQRLPLINDSAHPIADAILITEVTLP